MSRTPGPQVVDRSAARQLGAEVVAGTGIEALLALSIISGGRLDRFERGPDLARIVKRSMPESVERVTSALRTPNGDPWSGLVGLIATGPGPFDARAVIDRLQRTDPNEIKVAMTGVHLHAIPMRSGRPPSSDELQRTAAAGGWADELSPVAAVTPRQLARMVIEALKSLPEDVYLTHSASSLLERNAEAAMRLLAESDDAAPVIGRLTGGFTYRAEPGITKVLLIPSLVHRPWTLVLDHGGTKIVCFPARLENELSAPDVDLVAVYRALGDPTRLRILRRLASGAANLRLISEELGLAKSTVHEHLLSLRTAGLVRLVGGGFELQPELPDLNWKLKEYLGLEMRRQCENCGRALEPDSVAYICSYECTFCEQCAAECRNVCPNCGGELVQRPRRSKAAARRRPHGRARTAAAAPIRGA